MDLDGQFGRTMEARQVDELPAFELSSVAKVRILGQRIVLPATRVVDHFASQYSGGPVEIEEVPGARSGTVFQNEVAIEEEALHFCEEVEVAVEIAPTCLHDADPG